jgi:hypothetical protein
MHPDPKPPLDPDMSCQLCGREWSIDKAGNMMSKRRVVKIVGPLERGADINAAIKPTDEP